LKINTFKNGEVTGDMDMAILIPKKLGKSQENFIGYVIRQLYFIQGGYKEKTYKNQWHFKAETILF
jgi:hypothetical protein